MDPGICLRDPRAAQNLSRTTESPPLPVGGWARKVKIELLVTGHQGELRELTELVRWGWTSFFLKPLIANDFEWGLFK